MKFTIRRRNIGERISDTYENFCQRRKKRLIGKVEKLEAWHKKFAWRPLVVEDDNDDIRIVWLEAIYQQYSARVCNSSDSEWRLWKFIKRSSRIRYHKTDYFKKVLQGQIQNQDDTIGVSAETQYTG